MTKRNVKYQGLSIPVPIINKIKEHRKIHTEYTSVTNFIRDAIKEKIERDDRVAEIKQKRVFDYRVKRNPKNPLQPLLVEKDHTVKLKADIIELKKQMKEVMKELKNK